MIISRKIIQKIKDRDEVVFEKIYEEYYKLIYYIGLKITKDQDLAEEVMQDTFVKMVLNIDKYQEDGKFKQWLCAIARNVALNKVTRKKDKNVIYNEDVVLNKADQKSNLIDYILTINNNLKEEDADIVIKKLVYNYSFKEIAEEANLTLGVTQAKYYSAIKHLKKVL